MGNKTIPTLPVKKVKGVLNMLPMRVYNMDLIYLIIRCGFIRIY